MRYSKLLNAEIGDVVTRRMAAEAIQKVQLTMNVSKKNLRSDRMAFFSACVGRRRLRVAAAQFNATFTATN